MSNDDRMPTTWPQERMWTVSEDRLTVRMRLPPLPVQGMPRPLNVFMDLDARTVDEMIERLAVVRSQMLPPPERH